MAKISALELLSTSDGTEAVPVVKAGRARRMTLPGLAAATIPFLQAWYKGDKGDVGGNVMAIGSFAQASTLAIPVGADLVQTASWATGSTLGKARYRKDETLGDAYVAANPRTAFKSTSGIVYVLAEDILMPEMFGAIGDGSANDTDAFRALSAYVNARRGGRIDLRAGAVYIAGFQYRIDNFYLFGGNALEFKDCDTVTLNGNGATIRAPAGMKYGTFYPDTGLPYPSPQGYSDNGMRRADIGRQLLAWNVRQLRIYDLVCDGNVARQEIGGYWGDLGRQCDGDGYFIRTCRDVVCIGLRAINHARDGGLCAAYTSDLAKLTEAERLQPRPHTFINCSTNNVGRNGFSVIGCSGFLAQQCDFDNSGLVYNEGLGTTFGTAPGSGVDVEAEGGACRNVRFKACRFGTATGNTFVADTGDTRGITLEDCELNGIFWTSKPQTTLVRCTLNGVVRRAAGGARGRDGGTSFVDCVLNGNRVRDLVVDTQGSGPLEFTRCRFVITRGGFNLRGAWLADCSMTVTVGTEELANAGCVGFMEGADTTNFVVNSDIPAATAPANGYYIAFGLGDSFLRGNAKASGKIFWGVGGPSFQGELWTATRAYAAKSNPSGTAVMTDYVLIDMPLARRGDRVEVRFTGAVQGASWTGGVHSDDKIALSLIYVPFGALEAGSFQLRLHKGG